MRRAGIGAGAVIGVLGLLLGGWRVASREARELDYHGAITTLGAASSVTLGEVRIGAGEDARFELCARDGFPPEVWRDRLTVVLAERGGEEVARTVLDARTLGEDFTRRNSQGACSDVAGGTLQEGGAFVVRAEVDEALPAAARAVPLRLDVAATRPLDGWDALCALGVLLGALLIVLGLAGARVKDQAPAVETSRARTIGVVVAGSVALTLVLFAPLVIPYVGAVSVLIGALVIAAAHAGLGVALVPRSGERSRVEALGLVRPRRLAVLSLVLAPFAGVVLLKLGGVAARLVSVAAPDRGEAPIELLVAWPSASFAVVLATLVAPVAEEVFFRGFVFGALERQLGVYAAFGVSLLLFVLVHVPQDWGAWGALASVAVVGAGFTALRAATGSTLVSALAHLAHNALIAALTLL